MRLLLQIRPALLFPFFNENRYILELLDDTYPFRKRQGSCKPNGKDSWLQILIGDIAFDILENLIIKGIIVGEIGGDGLFLHDILEIPDGSGFA
jgi:hypothetical protein